MNDQSTQHKRSSSAASNSSSAHSSILAYGEAPLPQTYSPRDSLQQNAREPEPNLGSRDGQRPIPQSGGRYRSRALSVVGFHPQQQEVYHAQDDSDEEEVQEELEMGVLAKGAGGRGGWSVSSCHQTRCTF